MVVNNLLIRLKERDAQSIEKAKAVLEGMKGNIPALVDSMVKTDVCGGEYDIMLINTFNSVEEIPLYANHPLHLEVAKYVTEAKEVSVSFCYEL